MIATRGAALTSVSAMLFASVLSAQRVANGAPAIPLPPAAGFSIVRTLTTPTADRESFHSVDESSPAGLQWTWRFVEVHAKGDTLRWAFRYTERVADLAGAARLHTFWDISGPNDHPGYTRHALSRDVYRRIRATGSDSFQVMSAEAAEGAGALAELGLGGGRTVPVRWRGTLRLATPSPVSFPVLVNGRRVEVAALHLRGNFAARNRKWEPELWVLADSAYPLLLKWIGVYQEESNVLQTVRVDFPDRGADDVRARELERALTSSCRAEVPGIYFGFNSAVLDSASDRTIASVAAMLARHPDWTVTLEGHTDSIGSAAANRTLSERRVDAVRARLVSVHRVDGGRLRTAGYGSSKPREPNTTIEGRARNRRVELVRACARP